MHTITSLLLVLSFFYHVAAQPTTLTWDCTAFPNACENFCYVTYCQGRPNQYTKVDATQAASNRKAAGVRVSAGSPCRSNRTPWASYAARIYGGSIDADEWPPASSQQGGPGASLRCMPSADNQGAGRTLQTPAIGSTFNIGLSNLPAGNVFCSAQATPSNCNNPAGTINQFTYTAAGQYVGPNTPGVTVSNDTSMTSRSLSRRAILKPRLDAVAFPAPARFLTSRGVEVMVPTSPGHELDVREGDVVDEGEEYEDVIVKRLE